MKPGFAWLEIVEDMIVYSNKNQSKNKPAEVSS